MKKTLRTLAVLAAAPLILGGCFRQHIESTPPARKPAQTVETVPQPIIEETVTVDQKSAVDSDETYVVDAPADTRTKPAQVAETDLAEEPLPDADQLKQEAEAAATGTSEPKSVAESQSATTGTSQAGPAVVEGGKYFIQVGAFSDLENANRTLARLVDAGYTGSVVTETDKDLYRVQAGAFADESTAEAALDKLRPDYPKGFVLKK